MASENCHSRSLSWLVKACIPDPTNDICLPTPTPATTIAALPDDLLLECLSRVPSSSLAALPPVSRRFASLVSSPAFLSRRRALGATRPSLLALSVSDLAVLVSAVCPAPVVSSPFSVHANTIPPFPYGAFTHARAVTVGRFAYLIGRAATLRIDAVTAAVAVRAPTIFMRKSFAAASVGGKIYVAGGSSCTAAVEEYDAETDRWTVVGTAPRRLYCCIGASANGVFYIVGGVHVGGADPSVERRALMSTGSIDAFHVGARSWIRGASVPRTGCIVGACSVGEQIYLLTTDAVELSFWRYDGATRSRRSGNRNDRWTSLAPPPVQWRTMAGFYAAVRFRCAAVDKQLLVAVSHVVAARGNVGGGLAMAAVDGRVWVFDIQDGTWRSGPVLPPGFRGAVCTGVEC